MQPTIQPQQPQQAGSNPFVAKDGTQLDPTAATLTRAIRKVESDHNYNAVGDSGTSHGAYQFNGDNYKQWAKTYGENPDDFSPEAQDKVAYKRIKSLLDQGFKQSEVASIWNSGKADPAGNVGYNKKLKVKYDTPGYVSRVQQAYGELEQAYKQPLIKTAEASNGEQQPGQEKRGFLSSLVHGIVDPVATTVARPLQAIAELGGVSDEAVNNFSKNQLGGFVAPTPQNYSDLPKEVGRGAETVALGLPVNTLGGAVKAGVLAGAGSGLEEEGNLTGALKGAAVGAGAGLIGGGISKVFEKLPTRITKGALNLTDEQATKMLAEKGVGTKVGLLKQSEKAVADQSKVIEKMISEADKAGVRGAGNDAVKKTLLDFPEYNSDKGIKKMLEKVKSLIPSTAGFEERGKVVSAIDKIAEGDANLSEKNMVRKAIDRATKGGYSRLAKAMNPSAGHDLAMTFANNLRGEVQSWVPGTQTFFDELEKEMGIRAALRQAEKKGTKGLISYNDIVPYMMGQGAGGLSGGVVSAASARMLKSPATEFAIAKGVKGLGKIVKPIVSRAGLIPMVASGGKK